MTNRKEFMEFIREDLIRTRNYLFNIHEQRRPGDDPGYEIGPGFVLPKGMKPVKPFGQQYKPGTVTDLTTKPDEKPTLDTRPKPMDPNVVDPNTGYPDGMEPPDPEGVIPIPEGEVPDWVWEYLEGIGVTDLPEGFSFGIQPHGPGAFVVILDENGQIVTKLHEWNGIVLAFPPGAGIMTTTGPDGVPLIYVPAGNDQDGYPSPAIYHAGQQYIEFLFGAFPGLPMTDYPIYRGPNGEWYNQGPDGNPVPWPPQDYPDPGGTTPPDESDEGIAGWWSGLPDWLKGVIIAGAVAGVAWLAGTALEDWINRNEHTNQEGGGPPVPPGGDDSSEGGEGGEGDGGDDGNPGGP